MSSTLLTEDTGVPFDELQAEQIALYRDAWAEAGCEREPRISVSRSVIPITTDLDRMYFGAAQADTTDQVGYLDGGIARFGRSYIGEPDVHRGGAGATTRPSATPTRCCSPFPTSSASSTTRACSRRSPSTSRRRSAGSARRSDPVVRNHVIEQASPTARRSARPWLRVRPQHVAIRVAAFADRYRIVLSRTG